MDSTHNGTTAHKSFIIKFGEQMYQYYLTAAMILVLVVKV